MPRYGNAKYETTQKLLAAINAGKMTTRDAIELMRVTNQFAEGMDTDIVDEGPTGGDQG